MREETVTIVIDETVVQAKPGQTILEAADEAGVYIPRLCHHKDLLPAGHCRLCTVKVNGRPASACTLPVDNGLMVECDTGELNAMRRNIVEMLFVEGNHVCPSCEAGGDCELQALAYRLGVLAPQYPYLHKERALDASHEEVYLDRNRCVLCGRCARASRQLDGKGVFGFEGRGIETAISVDSAGGLAGTELAVGDKAARICPTGALLVKHEGYNVPVGKRPYDAVPIGAEVEKG